VRKETIGGCELYLGDCLEILPTLGGVDAVITDPPYSSGGFTRGDRALETSKKYQSAGLQKYHENFSGDNKDQRSWIMWMSIWIGAALRVSNPGAAFCLFTDWRQLPATTDALQSGGAVWRGIAVWDKVHSRPVPDRFRSQAEYIVWGTNGPREHNSRFGADDAAYLPGVFQCMAPTGNERQHSTQKPVRLMKNILGIAKHGETVLDPFMGSGTTGVACAETGRKFMGIEISEKYFDIACRRIEAATAQGKFNFEEGSA